MLHFLQCFQTIIDNFFCKLTDFTIKPKLGILAKQISDHQPYFSFLNTVPYKEPSQKLIKINIQNEKAISNFIHEIISSDVNNKLNQSPSAIPNINYNILGECIKCAKTNTCHIK